MISFIRITVSIFILVFLVSYPTSQNCNLLLSSFKIGAIKVVTSLTKNQTNPIFFCMGHGGHKS